jgi:uncharacterized repeat protein (TIGR03803 family)
MQGGGSTNCFQGCGTVYRLTTDGQEMVLHAFSSGRDGAKPEGNVVFDAVGNLYGTTVQGGDKSGGTGFGTVYTISASGTEKVLHTFGGRKDGVQPYANLAFDMAGNLYGTTEYGGANSAGTVFRLAPGGVESVLYSFRGAPDGAWPTSDLSIDSDGSLYGTTTQGGDSHFGTVFKLTPDGEETVLHSFTGQSDGSGDGEFPHGGVTADTAGNLYGTTAGDGTISAGGTVYKLNPDDGSVKVLHAFSAAGHGYSPIATLTMDGSGNLYGTTGAGGYLRKDCLVGCGTVFRVKE